MTPNPFLGVFFHWLGGLASGSFYVPYKGVKKWAWETYWLVGGFFSWIICPWTLAFFMTKDLSGVLQQQTASTLWWTYFFGAMWGLGGLTFGLTMRYLGMSLGMGVALGYCAAFGTLLPPIFKSFAPTIPVAETITQIAATTPGQVTLAGVAVCLFGIGIAALAGLTKEKEMPATEKKKAIAEFNFRKGIFVATFSGIMSACFAFALTAGNPIGAASKAAGTTEIWTGLPKLVVVLLGGFTTNFIWCIFLNIKNRTGHQYFTSEMRGLHMHRKPVSGLLVAVGVVVILFALVRFNSLQSQFMRAAGETDIVPLVLLAFGIPLTLVGIWIFFSNPVREEEMIIETAIDAPGAEMAKQMPVASPNGSDHAPMLANYFFSALAGTCWYLQFFFYTMGETQMGKFGFASWTLHMASIIIFSTAWGVYFHEWKGSSKKSHGLIATGIAMLILSTIIIGVGTWLKTQGAGQ